MKSRIGVACLLVACACSKVQGSGQDMGSQSPDPRAAAVSSAGGSLPVGSAAPANAPPPKPLEFHELIRLGRYKAAAKQLDAMSESERRAPTLRYARARVAAELEDYEKARDLLLGLDQEVPELADEIQALQAQAQLEVGPYDDAARYYSKQRKVQAQLRVARAYLKAKELTKAWSFADQAVRQAKKQDKRRKRTLHRTETEARLVRAEVQLARGKKKQARTDFHFAATQDPTHPKAGLAERELSKLGAKLSRAEQLKRIAAFGKAGNVTEATRLAAVLKAFKKPLSPSEQAAVLRARGFAVYNARSDYNEAAKLFQQAAALPSKLSAQDAFFAARALSRADRDEEAKAAYAQLGQRFSKSSYAEQAAYLSARLDYIGGEFAKAQAGYQAYLARYNKRGRGRYRSAVRYELAISQLAGGAYEAAAKSLAALAKGETQTRKRTRLLELEGAAWLGAGNKELARKRFLEVLDQFPLSFGAYLARLRLKSMEAEATGAGDAAAPGTTDSKLAAPTSANNLKLVAVPGAPPAGLVLPDRAQLFLSLGFVGDAERVLFLNKKTVLSKYHPRGGEALCELAGQTGAARERYRFGRGLIKGAALYKQPQPDNLWAWNCLYPRPYPTVVAQAKDRTGVSDSLLYAVMRQESAFKAEVGSSAGAVGLMQLLPSTAERVAEELQAPYEREWLKRPAYNIRLGSTYLARLLSMFEGVAPFAVASYNAGPHAVTRWLASGDSLPLDVWAARIPYGETREYLARVMTNWIRYSYLARQEPPLLELSLPHGLRAPKSAY